MKHIKDFFSTSTKVSIITGCILGILAVYGIRGVFAAGDPDTKKETDSTAFEQDINTTESHKSERITLEGIGTDAAKSIAVKHANMKEADVIFSKVKLDKDDGVMAYEIDFVKDGMEYEYTLEALTGDILEYDVERTDYN